MAFTLAFEEKLGKLISVGGIAPCTETYRKLLKYYALLEKWNQRINLSGSSIGLMFQEAIWSTKFYPHDAVLHLDVGSGAGFPAVIIRILVPKIGMELVESRTKRSVFLETAARELDLQKTYVYNMRLDEYLRENRKSWDCITWKGLKMRERDLLQLRERAHSETQFWMYHGRELPLENQKAFQDRFRLLRSEKFPHRNGWQLSIFIPLQPVEHEPAVSRET